MKNGEGRQAPVYSSCLMGLTVKHILNECVAFVQERRVTSLHGRSMSEVLGSDFHINSLSMVLKTIVSYYLF